MFRCDQLALWGQGCCRVASAHWHSKNSRFVLWAQWYVPIGVRVVEPTSAQPLRAGPIANGATQYKSELALLTWMGRSDLGIAS